MALRNHAACVGSYCDAIPSGEIIAGRYVELAVKRYLDDIEHAHERGLHFDAEIAERSLRFVETVCTHQKAECVVAAVVANTIINAAAFIGRSPYLLVSFEFRLRVGSSHETSRKRSRSTALIFSDASASRMLVPS